MRTIEASAHFPSRKERGEDGGAKVEAERSLQMRIFLSGGEQVHQGGSAVYETD